MQPRFSLKVDECRPLVGGGDGGADGCGAKGRGLLSSTSQLNLSRFCHKMHPQYPLIPPDTS